jgi:hypothetical protein
VNDESERMQMEIVVNVASSPSAWLKELTTIELRITEQNF